MYIVHVFKTNFKCLSFFIISNTVVTTTYVSVSELEGSSNDGTGHYTRLDGSEKIMLNPHLQDSHSSDSSDEDTRSSDDR